MPKCYSYIRFSRPEQLRGDSLRRQREAADKWAAANGMVIDESLTDLGVSAFRGKNRGSEAALGKFLDLVEAGRVEKGSYLIVESLDRISREEVIDVLPVFTSLIKAGIVIVTLIDGQVYSRARFKKDTSALFISLVVMTRAHEESKTKSERLAGVWTKKRASPDTLMTARVPGWLTVKTVDGKRLVELDKDREGIVKRIFAETIAGYGARRIAARLNADNEPAFTSKNGWQPSYIKKVIQGRVAIGELQPYSRGEDGVRRTNGPAIPGYYPAVVDERTFLRANAAKEGRAAAPGLVGEGVTNLLKGIARCGCGATMTRLNKGRGRGGGASFLTCSDASRAMKCENRRKWRLDEAERIVLRGVSSLDVTALLGGGQASEQPVTTEARVRREIEEAKLKRELYYDSFEQGDEGAAERAKRLSARIKALEAELAGMMVDAAKREAQPSPEQRRRRLAELFERLNGDDEADVADLRTRIAQELRSTLKRVEFAPHQVNLIYPITAARGTAIWIKDRKEIAVNAFDDNPRHVAESQAEAASDDADEMATKARTAAFFGRRKKTAG